MIKIKVKVIPFYSNLASFFLNYFDKKNRAYLYSNFPCQINNFWLEINCLPIQGFCQSRATGIPQKLPIPLVFQFYGVVQSLYSYIRVETRKLQSGYLAINSPLWSTSPVRLKIKVRWVNSTFQLSSKSIFPRTYSSHTKGYLVSSHTSLAHCFISWFLAPFPKSDTDGTQLINPTSDTNQTFQNLSLYQLYLRQIINRQEEILHTKFLNSWFN